MLLAEELALVAIDPGSGRHAMGVRDHLNACLAGLLIVEVQLDSGGPTPLLAAAADVWRTEGPKPKAALSAMNRGLQSRLGTGTWDSVVSSLVGHGVLGPSTGGLRPSHPVIARSTRDAIVDRLRGAAAHDHVLDVRTAALLSMTGPAQLLELVAPDRSTRKHARHRIDHALDATALEPIAESVRRVLVEAQAAVAAASVAASSAAWSS